MNRRAFIRTLVGGAAAILGAGLIPSRPKVVQVTGLTFGDQRPTWKSFAEVYGEKPDTYFKGCPIWWQGAALKPGPEETEDSIRKMVRMIKEIRERDRDYYARPIAKRFLAGEKLTIRGGSKLRKWVL